MIRIVAMDFDWTLVDHSTGVGVVHEALQEALFALRRRGIEVGIASGRYWWEMRNLLHAAGVRWNDPFPSFFITREAFLYRMKDGERFPDRRWNEVRAAEMSELNRDLLLRSDEWYERIEAEGLPIQRWILWGDLGLEVRFPTIDQAEQARRLLVEWTADLPNARVHRNRQLAHVVLATGGKGVTLAHAAISWGLQPENVLAIGDTLNDWDMLDGRLGLRNGTVGNADDVLKERVRQTGGVVAEAPTGAGVLEILREYEKRGLL